MNFQLQVERSCLMVIIYSLLDIHTSLVIVIIKLPEKQCLQLPPKLIGYSSILQAELCALHLNTKSLSHDMYPYILATKLTIAYNKSSHVAPKNM